MTQLDERLLQCFAAVFSGLSEEEIRATSSDYSGNWDSLTTVTLVAVIQEEFKVEINLSDIDEPKSYATFQNYLRRLDLDT